MRLAAASLGLSVALTVSLSASLAFAQIYPAKPIRLINPLGSGGTAEVLARTIAKQLGEQLGQQVIVETRAGAAGLIGAELVAKSPPDGYTLLYGVTGANTIVPAVQKKMPYDPVKDLVGISILFSGPMVLIVHPSLEVRSVRDLVEIAKAKPGALTYASGGNGSMAHLSTEVFKSIAAIDLVHVPYKGGGAAVPDLIGGVVNLMIETGPNAIALARSGKVRAIAVTTPNRSPSSPELPTFAEQGYPGVALVSWGGLFAPGGTPQAILDRLAEECAKAARNLGYREQVARLQMEAVNSTPEAFQKFVREEIAKWTDAVQKSGMKVD